MKLFQNFQILVFFCYRESKVEEETLQPAQFSCFRASDYIENKCHVTELCSKILNICRKSKTEQSSSL